MFPCPASEFNEMMKSPINEKWSLEQKIDALKRRLSGGNCGGMKVRFYREPIKDEEQYRIIELGFPSYPDTSTMRYDHQRKFFTGGMPFLPSEWSRLRRSCKLVCLEFDPDELKWDTQTGLKWEDIVKLFPPSSTEASSKLSVSGEQALV